MIPYGGGDRRNYGVAVSAVIVANENILPNCTMKQERLEELGDFSRLDLAKL